MKVELGDFVGIPEKKKARKRKTARFEFNEELTVQNRFQVLEEDDDDSEDVEVAYVKRPPAKAVAPVSKACHYVPGDKNPPQFSSYTKEQLEEALARVAATAS